MPKETEFKTTSSKQVYQNPWMTVREDTIIRPSGARGIYGVVDKPDFAVIVPLQDGQLHLVQQYRYPVRARFWEFPQGSSPNPVVNGIALAAAELREETGLTAQHLQHIGRHYPSYGYASQAYDVYLATELSQGESQLEAEEEGLISQCFAVDAVQQMIVDGEIPDATTVAAFGLLRLKKLL